MIGRRTFVTALAMLPLAQTLARAADDAPTPGIDRLDPALDRILAPDARVDIIARGYRWAEGPAWVSQGNYLLFNDPPSNILYRWTRAQGVTPFLSPSGLQTSVPEGIREPGLNGIAITASGMLVGADSGTRAIVQIDLRTRQRRILADRYEGKRFNSPNDLCVAPSGAIYFTDPPYGLAQADDSPLRELDFCGLYRLDPDGSVTLLDRSHRRPNGVGLSPDGTTLYLALSDEKRPVLLAYPLDAKGQTGMSRLFLDMHAELATGDPGLPDGMDVGPHGHVFATGPGGVHVCAPDGQRLGIIRTSKAIANCCIGERGRTLFLTSSDMLAMVPLRTS